MLIASWKRTSRGFKLWLEADDQVTGSGRTVDEAQEEFEAAVIDHTAAAEVAIEFVPPLPLPRTKASRAVTTAAPAQASTSRDVVTCSWRERDDDKTEVWVIATPELSATAYHWQAADEELERLIEERFEGKAVERRYDPPPPAPWPPRVDERALGLARTPALVVIAGNGDADVVNMADLYEGGLCDGCGYPNGPRNDTVMVLSRLKSGFAGLLAESVGPSRAHTCYLFSDAFLQALTDAEREAVEVRAVGLKGRARGTFFELVRVAPTLAKAALPGVPALEAACRACGRTPAPSYLALSIATGNHLPMHYLRAKDWRQEPKVFGLGLPPFQYLGMTAERWQELVRQRTTKGIKSYEVGVVK